MRWVLCFLQLELSTQNSGVDAWLRAWLRALLAWKSYGPAALLSDIFARDHSAVFHARHHPGLHRDIAAAALSPMIAQDQPPTKSAVLSEADQGQIAEAIIVYQKNPRTYLAANHFKEGHLTIAGHDTSAALISSLQRDGFSVQPGSLYKGDGYIVPIGDFKLHPSGYVEAELMAWCGGLCGGGETYSLHKTDAGWIVDSLQLNYIS
jgi:hypothetical protein